MPFVGPFTGAESLRNPLNRYVFNIRASYFDETDKIVGQLVGQTLDHIAVFYQNDDYGKAGLAGVERAMQKRNLKIVATGTVERNTVDVAAAVKSIGSVDPQGVIMISAYKSVPRSSRRCARRAQPAIHERILRRQQGPGARSGGGGSRRGHIPGRAVPWNLSARVVKEYQQLLEASTGKPDNFSWTSLEGFIAAKVLVEGLRRTGSGSDARAVHCRHGTASRL